MPRLLYTFLSAALLPFALLRLLWRSRKSPAYRLRWAERFGRFGDCHFDQTQPVIWLHAVSVGETLAAVPLIKTLQARHPDWQWMITTTTPTGSERVRAVFGNSVQHVYAPFDLPPFVEAFLRRVQPQLAIIMETELWPNLLHACRQRDIPTVVANARLSEKSARGYARFAPLTHALLQDVCLVTAQQQADGDRFLALGLPREKLQVTGSIKFDLDLDTDIQHQAQRLRTQWCTTPRPVWLAASTHQGEDEMVLTAFSALKKSHPDLLLVLSPRHPERFTSVRRLCEPAWRVCSHAAGDAVTSDTDIVLGDTMGELLAFYGAADIAFVGGSFVPAGGHNMIEPAAWACPIVTGPSDYNFTEVVRLLKTANALVVAQDTAELIESVDHWLQDADARRAAGDRARQVADANRGSLERLLTLMEAQLHAT
jgi:3-deoxy-D-manno-octulosonic-acid transferase